ELQKEAHLLLERATLLRQKLKALGLNIGNASTHIIPIILQQAQKTLLAQNQLIKQGIRVSAIRPPSVPANQSRLRVALNIKHDEHALQTLFDAIKIITSI
ncbi:MAG TPA: aminotransferase class I/II-fold pyridoxal phosphate-dependent enzyme, partial [Candidatus Berkiella sp.]|nr:aminotransferase class I/II-fold pyridoxal phosphate-dependent enzyme [Candidatus Berkiella sp.]